MMKAVVTTGIGGFERLEWREVPVPEPGPGELLLRVLAAGLNATDINTRIGWYGDGAAAGDSGAGGWQGATPFPLIQGVDCCGRVVAAGPGAAAAPVGARVLVRPCMRRHGFGSLETVWLGVDRDGAFAQYVAVPASEVFPVACDWSDAELAAIPCAWGTAQNMVGRAGIGPGMTVLVPGASGGVGSAAVQLAKLRGARVIAVTSAGKGELLRDLGADAVLGRDDDLPATLGAGSLDAVLDTVGGPGLGTLPKLLRRGGRYVCSGAVAGPVVALDLRDLYLRDLALVGCTAWDEAVFPDLVAAIEAGRIRPLVAASYPLERLAEAERDFLARRHVGKIVLIPPS